MLEDFEQQFDRSIALINESRDKTIFDRCPLDFLAYALVVEETSPLEDAIDIERWVEKMKAAIQLLDLIVFVPIEYRDRILVPAGDDKKLRKGADEKLQEILLDDSLGILENIEVLEVTGSLGKRVEMVKTKLQLKESQ